MMRIGEEATTLPVSAIFPSERDICGVKFMVEERLQRLCDAATVRRGYGDRLQPSFRVNGRAALGLAVARRDRGDILKLGRARAAEMRRIQADLPAGIKTMPVADPAPTVDEATTAFTESLWHAIAIVVGISVIALGVRPELLVAIAIPLRLAIVFPLMDLADIDLRRSPPSRSWSTMR